MKKYFVIALFCFLAGLSDPEGYAVRAQAVQVDSIKKLLLVNSEGNKKELQLLNSLAVFEVNLSPGGALANAEKAIAIAQKLNDQKELAIALQNKGFALLRKSQYAESLICLKKALAINNEINAYELRNAGFLANTLAQKSVNELSKFASRVFAQAIA